MADAELVELASLVSDGEAVDWDGAEARASDEDERRVVHNLRLVAGLAEVHRSASAASPAGEPRPSLTETVAGTAAEPGPRWGPLDIRGRLGRGAFGEVYRAWDPRLEREVALKLLRAEAPAGEDEGARVLHEGRLLARVRHPNVVAVHGVAAHDGRVGLWMELVDGRSLAALVEERGRFGAREATLIGIDLCRALAAVHGAGLVHRDVKAQNVLREEGGRILLMDFGAGRETAAAPDGTISGTPLYLAPEVLEGGAPTPRSDLYGLGVLLYHLVTGTYPVWAESLRELCDRHRRGEIRLLRDVRPDLPETFVGVVERALARDSAARFATAGAMERALAETLASPPAPAAAIPAPTPRARRALAGGVVLALVALVAVALWLAAGRGASGPERAPPAAEPYTIEATLFRLGAEGRREVLDTGDRLALGDALSLEVSASREIWFYVIAEDGSGRAFALFPLPDLDSTNPLAGSRRHTLPGALAGRPQSWRVDTPGGRERIVLLASPVRLVDYEAELNALPRPRIGELAQGLPDSALARLRGIGALAPVPESAPSGSAARLFDMAARLGARAETVQGAWVRQIELLGPAP